MKKYQAMRKALKRRLAIEEKAAQLGNLKIQSQRKYCSYTMACMRHHSRQLAWRSGDIWRTIYHRSLAAIG